MRSGSFLTLKYITNFPILLFTLAILLLMKILLGRKSNSQSQFKLREADRLEQLKAQRAAGDPLGAAKMKIKTPLRLEGLSLDGEPHEILGVRFDATPNEIQTAYRERMLRFHPDRIGKPGSREWQDAQEIAAKITQARADLLSQNKK